MTKSAAKIIFLDIDGVLLPFGGEVNSTTEKCCSGLFPDRTLQALSKIVSETGVSIVLSSTWRAREDFIEDILKAFRAFGTSFGGPLASMTEFHGMTNPENHAERQREIHDWLLLQKEMVKSWVALDDEELINEEKSPQRRDLFEGHVVKTKSDVGLTMKDAELAIQLLNK